MHSAHAAADADDEGDTTDGGPVDTDGDGLTDEEEAQLGTDPNLRDTDGDNYWETERRHGQSPQRGQLLPRHGSADYL